MSAHAEDTTRRIEREDRTVACVACDELADELEVDASGVCCHCRVDAPHARADTWEEIEMDLAA